MNEALYYGDLLDYLVECEQGIVTVRGDPDDAIFPGSTVELTVDSSKRWLLPGQ